MSSRKSFCPAQSAVIEKNSLPLPVKPHLKSSGITQTCERSKPPHTFARQRSVTQLHWAENVFAVSAECHGRLPGITPDNVTDQSGISTSARHCTETSASRPTMPEPLKGHHTETKWPPLVLYSTKPADTPSTQAPAFSSVTRLGNRINGNFRRLPEQTNRKSDTAAIRQCNG